MKPRRKTHLQEYSCPFGGKQLKDEQWIHRHPGGYTNLKCAYEVEPDAANILFLSYHTGHRIDRAYQIGKKYGYELPAQTAMHKELNAIFTEIQAKHWVQGWVIQSYTLILMVMLGYSFYLQLFHCTFLNRVLYGAISTSLTFHALHTRLHRGKLFELNWLNSLLSPLYSLFMNIHYMFPPQRWVDVHTKSHHIYTNCEEDNDVWMTYPFLYESPYFNVLRHHRFQWLFVPIIFALLSLAGPIRQIVPFDPITNKRIGHPLYILLHVLICIVLPYYVYGGMYPVYLHFGCNAFFAACYAYLFQVSHNQVLAHSLCASVGFIICFCGTAPFEALQIRHQGRKEHFGRLRSLGQAAD